MISPTPQLLASISPTSYLSKYLLSQLLQQARTKTVSTDSLRFILQWYRQVPESRLALLTVVMALLFQVVQSKDADAPRMMAA